MKEQTLSGCRRNNGAVDFLHSLRLTAGVVLFLVCALFLAGCALQPVEYYNYKPGESNVLAAKARCHYVAQNAGSEAFSHSQSQISQQEPPVSAYGGFAAGAAPGIARAQAYNAAFYACMSELGWLPK